LSCATRSTKDAPLRTAGTLGDTIAGVKAVGGEGIAVSTNLAEWEPYD
jgi:hypothetical protein